MGKAEMKWIGKVWSKSEFLQIALADLGTVIFFPPKPVP